jgi:hypothetical protein
MFLTLFSQNALDGSRVPRVNMLVTASARSREYYFFLYIAFIQSWSQLHIFKCEKLRGRSEERREQEENYLYRGKYIKGGGEHVLWYSANKKCKYYF